MFARSFLPIVVQAAIVVVALQAPARSEIINVPGDQPSIQAGINAANPGDEVVVAPGTYVENINFNGKAITVRSTDPTDPAVVETTIIDGDGNGSVVTCDSGEGPDTTLEGLTVTGGSNAAGGAGIRIVDASPVISNNLIVFNQSSGNGGGALVVSGSPIFRTNEFRYNQGSLYGGGIYIDSGAAALVESLNRFYGNYAAFGGAVGNRGTLTVIDAFIQGNTSINGNAIVNHDSGDAVLVNLLITGNSIQSNQWDWGSTVLNSSGGTMLIANCSISGNAGNNISGGVASGDSDTTIVNTLVWGNTPHQLRRTGSGVMELSHSNVQGGLPAGVTDGGGNIDADPLFVDPDGPDGDPDTFADNDCRLSAGSPCIDAADNTAVPEGIVTELDGNPRFIDVPCVEDRGNPPGADAIVDMGPYESQFDAADCNANGETDICDIVDGTSVDCNTNSIPDECDIAGGTSADCNGTGVPDECEEPDCNENGQADSCDIADGTSADCNGNAVPDECDFTDGTSEDCNGNGIPDECIELEDDCNNNGIPDECIELEIDCNGNGFPDECETVTPLYVDDDASGDPGPGDPSVSDPDEDGSPEHPYDTIQKALTTANCGQIVVAPGTYNENINLLGKPVHLHSGDGPAVTTIDAQGSGTVVTCDSGEGPDTILEGFTITGGNAFGGGGMLNDYSSSPTVSNCTFSGNSASSGGGMLNYYSSPTVTNCTFSGNLANYVGGGIWQSGYTAVVTNCTFSENTAPSGGAMHVEGWGALTVANSVLWGNNSGEIHSNGVCAWNEDSECSGDDDCEPGEGCILPYVTISYSNVQGSGGSGGGWDAYLGTDGGGNIDSDPFFVDPDNGDFRPAAGSPCIDAADNTAVPVDILTDLDGNPRFVDDPDTVDTGNGTAPIVDMGAYEFQGCDVAAGTGEDCNNNGIRDDCDVAAGASADCNTNGTPDECEFEAGCPGLLPADTDCDGSLTGLDISGFVKTLVEGGYTCQADLDQDGSVSLSDVALFNSAILDS